MSLDKTGQALVGALTSVDWADNLSEFCKDVVAVNEMAALNLKLAIWARQLESVDNGNPALSFVREMQVAGHLTASTTALAIYKAAAASMRTVLESALYYTYFRSHLTELSTLVRDDKWYISKGEILDFHSTHTRRFNECQKKLPVIGPLNTWYSKISAVVHGQVPGKWTPPKSISETKFDHKVQALVIENFTECVDIVSSLFFCTVAQDFWDHFSAPAKKALIHGMHGETKTLLGLDSA